MSIVVTETQTKLVPLLCYIGEPASGKTHALLAEAHRRYVQAADGLAETMVLLCPHSAQAQALRHTVGEAPFKVWHAGQFCHSLVAAFPGSVQAVMRSWGQPSPTLSSPVAAAAAPPSPYSPHFIEKALLVSVARLQWLADDFPALCASEATVAKVVEAWLADGPQHPGGGGPALTQVMAHPVFQTVPNAPTPQAMAQAVAHQLMQGVNATRLVPEPWADELALAVVQHLQAHQPKALAQLHQQFRGVFIDELPQFSPSLQAVFHALLPYGVAMVATGEATGMAHWLAGIPSHPRTIETLPLLTATTDPTPTTRLPEQLPGMTAWQIDSFTEKPVFAESSAFEPLSWLTLHQPETFDEEVALVCQTLQAHPSTGSDDSPPWTVVTPSRFWQAQWIEALSLAGLREPAVAHRLRIESSLLSAAKVWLTLFQAAMVARVDSPSDDQLTPQDWADQLLPHEAIVGPQHPSNALGQLTQAAWRAYQQGDPVAQWLPELLTQWWQTQGHEVSVVFWNGLHQAINRPLGQALPVIQRVAEPATAPFLALVLAKLAAQPEPLASDEGLPCRVLTLKKAQGLWLGRVMVVSVMEPPVNPLALLQTAIGVSALGELVVPAFDDGNDEASAPEPPLVLADLLPPVLSRIGEAVWVSTHQITEHTGYTPSPLVEAMAQAAETMSGQPWPLTLAPPIGPEDCLDEAIPVTRVNPLAPWNTLPAADIDNPTPLWPTGESLSLSPTSIETYMRCPRQFYYKTLLRLPDDTDRKANEGITPLLVGQLAHKVLELFNRQVTPPTHNVDQLLALAEPLLAVDRHRHAPPPQAFSDSRVYQQYRRLSPLEQDEVASKILASLADLGPQGYFDRPVVQVIPEIRLNSVVLPELPMVTFSLAADALLRRPSGDWDLLDYKTYGYSAFCASPDTNADKLAATLEPLDETATTHAERFVKKDLQHKKRLVQLPLYYFAFSANPSAVEASTLEVGRLALQVLRPPKDGDPKTGSVAVTLPVEQVKAQRNRWLRDLYTGVVSPIVGSAVFEPLPEPAQCGACPYMWLCDSASEGDDSEGSGSSLAEGGDD